MGLMPEVFVFLGIDIFLAMSLLSPFLRCRPERLPMDITSEDGYGVDPLGNGDSTDPDDISGFHLFLPRKWRGSKLVAHRDSDSRSPSASHKPQHIRVLT